jgi:hypothetical protein
MAWGGSLNKEGSDHIREMKQADNVVKFLEKFKEKLDKAEKMKFDTVIDIIVKYYTKENQL